MGAEPVNEEELQTIEARLRVLPHNALSAELRVLMGEVRRLRILLAQVETVHCVQGDVCPFCWAPRTYPSIHGQHRKTCPAFNVEGHIR